MEAPKGIRLFRGRYAFLSNFHPCSVHLYGIHCPSVEHAYQACKATTREDAMRIINASTPGIAKRLGRTVKLRSDWEQIKVGNMHGLVWEKFQNPTLRTLLLATGDAHLEEGNNWGDRFWGTCGGVGENHLGRILMNIRSGMQANA